MIHFRLKNHRARVYSGWGHLVEGAPPPRKNTTFFSSDSSFFGLGEGAQG